MVKLYYVVLNDNETFSSIEGCKIVMVDQASEEDCDAAMSELTDLRVRPLEWDEPYVLATGGIGIRHRKIGECYTLADGSCIGIDCIHDRKDVWCACCGGDPIKGETLCQFCKDQECKPVNQVKPE